VQVEQHSQPLRSILDAVEPKPAGSAPREDKHGYAMALSRHLAVFVADALRTRYPSVLPTSDNVGHESMTGAAGGSKRADVKVWDDLLGLLLLVSLKTYSFQDWDNKKQLAGRYTKNVQRNGRELKDEADVIHRRQPYAVIVAIMFIPITACDDGDPNSSSDRSGPSSFASMVRRLRVRTGRSLDPDEKRFDRYDLTERLYVGLYEYDEPQRGAVRFFDVIDNPPKNGRPPESGTLSLNELVEEIEAIVARRNSAGIEWAVLTEDDEGDAE
jgi:hypothetical protein